LISNRLVETFRFDADLDGAFSAATANGAIYALTTTAGDTDSVGVSFAAGDIMINGQSLDAFDATSVVTSDGDDIWDLVNNINTSVDNVVASAFNTVVAKTVGDGVVTENSLAIRVDQVGKDGDAHYQPQVYASIAASSNMEELVANINRVFTNDEVVASINSDGKLVLSNDTGAAIRIQDTTGTDTAYDGATGFEVTSGTVTATSASADKWVSFQGFLKLQSTDGSAIEIERGNIGLAAPGTLDDLKGIGFVEIKEDPTGSSYTVNGSQLTAAQVAATMSKSSDTGQADLSINGVEIYDDTLTLSSGTFQGKLDMINAFSDQTNVVASAYYERVYDTSSMTFVDNNQITINGVSVDTGTSVSDLASNINGTLAVATDATSGSVTKQTGIWAEAQGTNLILRGDGVQNVNIVNETYSVASSVSNPDNTMKTFINAANTRTATFAAADVKTGRTLTLQINATSGNGRLSAQDMTFSYTVQSSDTLALVVEKFYNLILEDMIEQSTNPLSGSSAGTFISFNGTTLRFTSAFSAGSAEITIGVTQVAASKLLFAKTAGQTLNHFGALKLQSNDGNPIRINFGEGSASDGELGLVEMNVGDSLYDANDPTGGVSQTTVSTVAGINVATSDAATAAIEALDAALAQITSNRADLGAVQNRLNHTVSNLANVVENTSASQSRILDADFAVEAAALARAQILQQAGTAMLAQANAAPQNVLSLLG